MPVNVASTFDPFADEPAQESNAVPSAPGLNAPVDYDPFANMETDAPQLSQETAAAIDAPREGEIMESPAFPIPETGKLLAATAYGIASGDSDPAMEALEDLSMKTFGRIQALGAGTRDLGLGAMQLAYDQWANMNDDPEAERQANLFTAMTAKERALLKKEIERQFGDDIQMDFFEEAGKIVPFFIFGGPGQKVGGAVQSFLKNTAGMGGAGSTIASGGIMGVLAGGISSPLEFKESALLQDRLEQDRKAALWGAAIGGGLGPVLSLFPALKNLIRDKIETSIDPVRLKEMEGLIDETGVDTLTLGQVTGSPLVESAEAVGARAPDTMRRRAELDRSTRGKFRAMFDDLLKQLKTGKSFSETARKAYDDTVDGLVRERSRNGQILFPEAQKVASDQGRSMLKNMTPAQRSAFYQQHPEFAVLLPDVATIDKLLSAGKIIHGKRFIATLDEMIAEAKLPNAAANPSEQARVIADLEKRRAKFIESTDGTFFMSPAEMQANLASYGRVITATGNTIKDIGEAASERIYRKLRGALYEDLNAAAQSKLPGAAELKRARDRWAKDSIPIEEIRDTGLETLFGSKVLKDDKQLRNAFVNMDARKLDAVLHILGKHAPDLRQSLAADWLGNAMVNATGRGANAGLATFDNLFNGNKLFEVADNMNKFKVVFPDPAMRRRIMAGLDLWAKIKPMAHNMGRLESMVQSASRVAVSLDPVFGAGLAQQLFTPSALSKVLMHKDGLKVLREMSKPFNAVRWGGALLAMSKMTGAYQAQAEMGVQRRKQREEEAQRMFLQQGGIQAM